MSAYSLAEFPRAAAPLMTEGGSIVSMTYYGAEKVVANYNVMGVAKAALEASTRYLASDLGKLGVRVNTISAGPLSMFAARGVGNLSTMLKHHADVAPCGVTSRRVRSARSRCSSAARRVVPELRATRTVRQEHQTWDILQRQLSTLIQEPVTDIFRA